MSGGDWKEMLSGAQDGNLDLVKYHIEAGINPNYQHPELLTTPLIESISFQHFEIVEYLLIQGADPDLKAGFSDDSPLLVAKQTGNKEIIELIQRHASKENVFSNILKNIISKMFNPLLR